MTDFADFDFGLSPLRDEADNDESDLLSMLLLVFVVYDVDRSDGEGEVESLITPLDVTDGV